MADAPFLRLVRYSALLLFVSLAWEPHVHGQTAGGDTTATQSTAPGVGAEGMPIPGDPPPPSAGASVSITPASGSWSGTGPGHPLDVVIDWCNPDGPMGGRVVKLNGQAVTLQYHPFPSTTACTGYGRSTGTVTLPPGSSQLVAEHWDAVGVSGHAQASYSYAQLANARVAPYAASVSVPAGSQQVAGFWVVNTGMVSTTWFLSTTCSGATGCAPAPTSVAPMPGDSVLVNVAYTAPSSGGGQVQLTAASNGVTRSGATTVATFALAVRVTSDPSAVTVAGGTPHAARFRVVNTGAGTTTYALTPLCTGTAVCEAFPLTVQLAAGDSAFAQVSIHAPASGAAVARLTAAAGSAISQGTVNVTALAAPNPGFPGDDGSLTRIERGACVTMAIGPAAAYECGDLRVVHGLPGVRVLNRGQAPVLVYNSQHARPYPIVAEQVAPLAGTAPDSVIALLTLDGDTTRRAWPGWSAGVVRRIAVVADGAGLPTGVYPYRLEIRAQWNNGTSDTIRTRSGRIAVVNREASPFGAGWWMAGVEQIHHVGGGDTLKLWVGGDGSARLYRGAAGGPWTAAGFRRPETLQKQGTEYFRALPGGAKVWFDAFGYHVRTQNTVGHTTHFAWVSFATDRRRLASVTLPSGASAPEALQYIFEYNNNAGTATPRLSKVRAPWTTGYRDTGVLADTYGRVTRVTDPDGEYVQYTYRTETALRLLMKTRIDRRGHAQEFGFSTYRLRSSVQKPAAGDTIRLTFFPAENYGISSAALPSLVETRLDGPRGQVGNLPERVYWKVDRWGAPTSTRSPGSAGWMTTQITRGDPRWPGLVTRVVAPNGFTTTAAYDARGNMLSQTAWNPYGDNRNATTSFSWNATWDAPTRVVAPEGETTTFGYDAYGRRAWERPADDSLRQVTFGYNAPTHATAPGLLTSVKAPLSGTDTIKYDARGNLSATIAASGARTNFVSDRIGRDTLVDAPSDGVMRLRTSMRPDLMDRDSLTIAYGDTTEGNLHVLSEYDENGRPKTVSRWGSPDKASVGIVRRQWGYDEAGRGTQEWDETNALLRTVLDRSGNALEVITRRGDTIRTTYDAAGRPLQRIIPEVRYQTATRAIYDARKGTLLRQDVFPYPGFAAPNGDFVIPADTVVFRYHPQSGLMIAAENRDAQVRRGYFPNGQLRADTTRIRTWDGTGAEAGFAAHEYVLEYTYDLNGRRRTLTVPANIAPKSSATQQTFRVQEYGYDRTTGALSRIRNVLGQEYRYRYNFEGAIDSIFYPGERWESFTYGVGGRPERRLIESTRFDASFGNTLQTVVRDTVTSYQDDGKVARVVVQAVDGQRNYELSYTQLGRLRESRFNNGSSGGTAGPFRIEAFRWDAMGNRLEAEYTGTNAAPYPSVSTYLPGTNRIDQSAAPAGVMNSGVPTNESFYDAAGNLEWFSSVNYNCTTTSCGTGTTEQRLTRSYYGADDKMRANDGANCFIRLIQTDTTGTPHCQGAGSGLDNTTAGAFEWYRYDALGRRVLVRTRRDHSCNGEEFCTSEITRYVWAGDQILFEIRNAGGPVASSTLENDRPSGIHHGSVLYTHGHKLDQPLDVIRMGHSSTAQQWGGPYPVHPIADWRGSFINGTDWEGRKLPCGTGACTIIWPQYSAFYVRQPATQTTFFGSLIWGKEDASGLQYMRNRYYNPQTGAFTQQDPIGLAGGLNTYGFANGDPVSFSDPYGLRADSVYIIGGPTYRKQVSNSIYWLAEHSPTFRRTFNAAATSSVHHVYYRERGATSCPSMVPSCVDVTAPGRATIKHLRTSQEYFSAYGSDGYEAGAFTPADALRIAHELGHAVALLGMKESQTGVGPGCAKSDRADPCADANEDRIRGELKNSGKLPGDLGAPIDPE